MADWVVVIEATSECAPRVSVGTIRRMMELMADRNPTTLYSPDRYALQVIISAASADQALRRALAAWRAAQDQLGIRGWELLRAEVITQAEFEQDARRRNREFGSSSQGDGEDLEYALLRQVFHDPVTGLANRELFMDHLSYELRRAERNERPLSLLLFQLGSRGALEGQGEALIAAIADRLSLAARGKDSVARLGHDLFAVLLDGVPEDSAAAIGSRLLGVLREPLAIGTSSVVAPLSVGVATRRSHDTADSFLARAQLALTQSGGDKPLEGRTAGLGGPKGDENKMHARGSENEDALVRRRDHALTAVAVARESGTWEEELRALLQGVCSRIEWPFAHLRVRSAEVGRGAVPGRQVDADVPEGLGDLHIIVESTLSSADSEDHAFVRACRQPVWVSHHDAGRDSAIRAGSALREGFTVGIGVPVISDDGVVGVLECFLPEAKSAGKPLSQILNQAASEIGRWWSTQHQESP